MDEKIYNANYSVGGKFKPSIPITWIQFNNAVNALRERYEKDPFRLPIPQTFDCPDEVESYLYRDIGKNGNIQVRRFCFGHDIITTWSDDKSSLKDFVIDELGLPELNLD